MKERAQVFRSRSFAQFLTLLPSGPTLMAQALRDLQAAHDAAADQFQQIQARYTALAGQNDEYWGINPVAVMTNKRSIDLTLQETSAILKGPATVSSIVTNESVMLDIPSFFAHPPQDLKVFLPTAFVEDKGSATERNYRWGSPTAWDGSQYQPYITNLAKLGTVGDAARILAQSRGGAFVAAAMSSVVN